MTFDGASIREEFQGEGRNSREGEGSLIGLLCSRNARPEKALVRRAQWETDSGHTSGGGRSELGWSID